MFLLFEYCKLTIMDKIEKIEEFYKRKFNWVPENIQKDIGHFNVFHLDPYVGKNAKPVPYRRRDYYKIMLVKGSGSIFYADQVIEVEKQALSFSNPNIPYKWENTENIDSGEFCVFTDAFFHQFGDLSQYPVFQPEGTHIFELTDEQAGRIKNIYDRMFDEIESEYEFKYDALRNLVFELIHFAMKMQPAVKSNKSQLNANQRISAMFFELLERQFPIDENHQQVKLRSAADFADQLNIHVNHLNRAVKETTQKTTSQVIAERILRESKILLKHGSWNVSEIAFALGFTEATHFNNFFKKHVQLSPMKFRNT